jgi:C-terminal processing protease CtpA/Prc
LIERVASAFENSYVSPETGNRMSTALRTNEKRGDYRSIHYGIELAQRLTQDLREISRDRHAEVRFSFFVGPLLSSADRSAAESRHLAENNCGFVKMEHLQPNIGYVKVDMFADPALCARTGSAAMNFVADSDALILDLRDNRGGGGMGEFIASYLFEERTHLNDAVDRTGDVIDEGWTSPDVPGKKLVGKPVFILTSKRTFSAAEDLSYAPKNLRRATLVGETTRGGAHLIKVEPLDAHFVIAMPYARSVSPITKTNWEGTGIEPDVMVPADEALDVAVRLAVEGTYAGALPRSMSSRSVLPARK